MCSGSTLTHRTRKGGMGIRQAWLPEMEGKSVPSRLLDLAGVRFFQACSSTSPVPEGYSELLSIDP